MAKRVIQMYDKYKSTTKTYPKVIKECLQEDVTDYIEGQVKANPTLAGTEASLEGLQVGDTKYKVEQPINVVANPSPAGTTELTGIQIGTTKYKINSGKQLYQHNIKLDADYCYIYIVIISDRSTAYTKNDLSQYLMDNNIDSINSALNSVNGYYARGGEYSIPMSLFYETTNGFVISTRDTTSQTWATKILTTVSVSIDKVVEL